MLTDAERKAIQASSKTIEEIKTFLFRYGTRRKELLDMYEDGRQQLRWEEDADRTRKEYEGAYAWVLSLASIAPSVSLDFAEPNQNPALGLQAIKAWCDRASQPTLKKGSFGRLAGWANKFVEHPVISTVIGGIIVLIIGGFMVIVIYNRWGYNLMDPSSSKPVLPTTIPTSMPK